MMTVDDEKKLIREYGACVGVFQKLEVALDAALDRLAEARSRDMPVEVTPARKRAEQACRDCNTVWENVEAARRAYWMAKAAQAEQELEVLAMPLIAAIEFCNKAGGSRVSSPSAVTLSRLGCLPRPQYLHITPVPALPEVSVVMERAEDEI